MSNIRAFFVAMLAVVWCLPVGAATTCAVWAISGVNGTFPTPQAACEGWASFANSANGTGAYSCLSAQSGSGSNGTFVPAGVIVVDGRTNAQFQGVANPTGIPCPVEDCTANAGIPKVTNFTVCYGRGNGLADCATPLSIPMPGSTQCIKGCSVGVNDPVSAFRSETVTSTGLYRLSMDSQTVGTGQACNGDGEETNPEAATPDCVGSLGEVNGKPFCAGTAANPTGNDKDANLPIPTTPGNPAAGPKPATGEGSGSGGAGRTPTNGSGGAAGGPAAAAGTGASGNVQTPAIGTQQANCGAPGQPACKIDETGTPAKVSEGVYNGKLDAYKDAAQGARDDIKGSGSGIYDGWTGFFFAPPLVTCSGMDLPTVAGVSMGKIDPCEVVEGMRTVMAYIWALTALWLCLGMVKRANT